MKQIERQERTKRCISLALYSLMLQKPYDDISVSDICQKAGVSRVSFYHYYDRKDDIFIQYSDEKFAEFYDAFAKMDNISFEDFIIQLFHFFKKTSRQLLMLKNANRQEILVDQFYSYCKYIFFNNQTSYLFKGKDDPVTISFVVGGIFEVIMRWIDEGMHRPPEEIAKYIINILK